MQAPAGRWPRAHNRRFVAVQERCEERPVRPSPLTPMPQPRHSTAPGLGVRPGRRGRGSQTGTLFYPFRRIRYHSPQQPGPCLGETADTSRLALREVLCKQHCFGIGTLRAALPRELFRAERNLGPGSGLNRVRQHFPADAGTSHRNPFNAPVTRFRIALPENTAALRTRFSWTRPASRGIIRVRRAAGDKRREPSGARHNPHDARHGARAAGAAG